MAQPVELFGEPETSQEEIFRATFEALKTYGLADLSIQQIADEATLGKSTIYHHFDSKDDLLTTFVSHFMETHVETMMLALEEDDMLTMFGRALDLFILGEDETGTHLEELCGDRINDVYLQLRAQAATDEDYREAMGEADSIGRERIVDLVEAGIAADLLRADADPDRVAATLYAYVETSLLVTATSDETAWLADLRASADDYMEWLVADDVEWERSRVLAAQAA